MNNFIRTVQGSRINFFIEPKYYHNEAIYLSHYLVQSISKKTVTFVTRLSGLIFLGHILINLCSVTFLLIFDNF